MDMDDYDFLDDTKALRKSMFICQHQRGDHVMANKLRRMGLIKKRSCQQTNDDVIGGVNVEAFSFNCRALKNADILEHIAMNLPDKDLLNCRLVCKHWSVEMAYFLSKRKSLMITDDDSPNANSMLKKRLEGQPIALSRLGLFNVSPSCPLYKKILRVLGRTLSNVSIEGCNLSPADLRQMFFCDAPNIESFNFRKGPIDQRSSTSVDTFKEIKILNNGSLSLPQLKMLHWDEHNSQTELKEFIEACPNLVTLELRNFRAPRAQAYKNLKWESLRNMFLSPKTVLENDHCKALTFLNLKLEKLTLFGLNSNDLKTMKSLSRFLSTLSENLQVLELWLDYGSMLAQEHSNAAHYSPLTVCLPKVTRLHTETEILGHLNNLRKLPSITDLEVVSNHHLHQNWSTLTKRAVVTRESKILSSFRCGDIDLKSLEKVMKVFPQITSLNIYATHVDDKLLRSIFVNLTLLVELTISPCFKSNLLPVSDSGITGIRAERCAKLRNGLHEVDESTVQDWQSQPDIGKLKCLQKLDLSFSVSEMITDVSIFFGISKLSKLNTLRLPVCQITDASLSAIENRLGQLLILGIAGCKEITDKAITDLKQQRDHLIIDSSSPDIEIYRSN